MSILARYCAIALAFLVSVSNATPVSGQEAGNLQVAQLGSQQFTEVTSASGLSYTGESYGASWGDINGDGWPDLWVGNHGYRGKGPGLYRNNADGTFTNVAATLPDYRGDVDVHGAAWADIDNDGDLDLYVTTGGQDLRCLEPRCANQLFVNDGGRFTDQAATMGLDYYIVRARTPVWFDYDVDGRLDVFVAAVPGPGGSFSKLFTNLGSTFADLHGDLAASSSNYFGQISLSNAASPDARLFIVHGKKSHPDHIFDFSNFSLIDSTLTIGFPGTRKVEDIAIADFNGDLSNDFYLARTTWKDRLKINDTLIMQTGSGFKKRTAWAGITVANACRSVVAADFDNDTDVDLYLVCGGIKNNDPNVLYENLGNGKFRMVPGAGGAAGSSQGRGESVAVADYDRDGFLDLFVTNGDNAGGELDSIQPGGPHQLFHNNGNANHWLQIDLQGTVSNRDGVGTRLLLIAGGKTQLREQNGGVHRSSQNHQRIHFGLGASTIVTELRVYWPSGVVQLVRNIDADQIVRVVEPGGSPPPAVAAPTITPNGGTFTGSVNISFASATAGTALHYTTDGSQPGKDSTLYSGAPITLTESSTVKAVALLDGRSSAVTQATFTKTVAGGDRQPYGDTPVSIPGRIETENYDHGGEGVTWHDTTTGNKGGVYRSDDVDIWNSSSEGFYTGANATGEWLEYALDVGSAGEYVIELRIATPKDGRRLHLEIAGSDVSGPINLPNTGGWQSWQTVASTVALDAGTQVVRIVFDRGGLNINWMRLHQ